MRALLTLCLLSFMVFTNTLNGQEIGGISTVPLITEARFPVKGLEVPQGNLEDLSKWASKLVVGVNTPSGAEASLEVDIGLVKRQPILYFSADKAGTYVIVLVDTSAKNPVIVTKRVQVGDAVNPPPPGPGPVVPTPVVAKGPKLFLVWYELEKNNLPLKRMTYYTRTDDTFLGWLKSKGHQWWNFEEDLPLPSEARPAMKAAVEKAKAVGSPVLVIVDLDTGSLENALSIPNGFNSESLEAFLKEKGYKE